MAPSLRVEARVREGRIKVRRRRNSLMVQRLRLCTFNAGGTGVSSGQGTKISHAAPCGQKINTHFK